ncbi:acyltransferase family protein [Acidisoma silvae]|uniref:Acyltransferase n=1 Tax=Acidisoma silvae TaxID=2802396 RepID=A0A963YQG5_9PROT|nr:acyltransferase [Acidisoma silvae]MCB8875095.1 acyltransferase [Acidisoma silvae]
MSKSYFPSPIIGSLELSRFAAAAVVVLSHQCNLIVYLIGQHGGATKSCCDIAGAAAVVWFFVLSGFVLVLAHGSEQANFFNFVQFVWKRLVRIYPLYLLALAVPCIYLFRGQSWPVIWQYTKLEFSLLPFSPPFEYVVQAWTLRYEVAFYIILSLSFIPYIGRPFVAIWVGAVMWHLFPGLIAMAQPHFVVSRENGAYVHFFAPLDLYFMSGCVAAWMFRRFIFNNIVSAGFLLVGILSVGAQFSGMRWNLQSGAAGQGLTFGIALAAMIMGLAGLERSGGLPMPGWSRYVGQLSYPLYILHVSIMLLINELWPLRNLSYLEMALRLLLICFGSLVTAMVAERLLDRPIQQASKKILSFIATMTVEVPTVVTSRSSVGKV